VIFWRCAGLAFVAATSPCLSFYYVAQTPTCPSSGLKWVGGDGPHGNLWGLNPMTGFPPLRADLRTTGRS